MSKKIETRNGIGEIRRVDAGSRLVEGYAVVFDSWSQDLGGFREKISRTAFDGGVLENSDVFALLNHNRSRGILGRSKHGDMKSLRLEVDEKGLRYSFEAPNTALGEELLSCLDRGEIDSSSFGFTVRDGGDVWTRNGDMYERVVTQFDQIFDVSPVYNPAYLETTCDLRGLETLKAEERAAEERQMAESKRVALGKYIADLKCKINKIIQK
jgi:HK97 family phage prohead protease